MSHLQMRHLRSVGLSTHDPISQSPLVGLRRFARNAPESGAEKSAGRRTADVAASRRAACIPPPRPPQAGTRRCPSGGRCGSCFGWRRQRTIPEIPAQTTHACLSTSNTDIIKNMRKRQTAARELGCKAADTTIYHVLHMHSYATLRNKAHATVTDALNQHGCVRCFVP